MRNWSNPIFEGTLDEAVAQVNARWREKHDRNYVSLVALEVRGPDGQVHTLAPQYDGVGYTPLGPDCTCSALGLGGTRYEILRVGEGYPGQMEILPPERAHPREAE